MKGEFKKRFLESTKPLLEQIEWLEGYGDTHQTHLKHKSAFDRMIKDNLELIDEARKEFPKCESCTFNNCYWQNQHATLHQWCPPRKEWFEKWLRKE